MCPLWTDTLRFLTWSVRSQGSHFFNTAIHDLYGMKLVRLSRKESVSLQSMDDPVDISLRLHAKTFGDNFVRRRYAVDTNVSLDEV